MHTFLKTLACLSLAFLSFSCSDDDDTTPEPPTQKPLNEWQVSMWQIEEIATEIEALARGRYPNSTNFLNCATVVNQIVPEGLQTIFTFSDAIPCSDGRTRKGKITMLTSNQPEYVVTMHLEDYFVDGVKSEGGYMVAMAHLPLKPKPMHMISSNAQVIPPAGRSFSFSLNRYSALKEGHATPEDLSDDVVEVFEAEYSGIKQKGVFLARLLAPVVIKKTCPSPGNRRPVEGKIQLEMTTGQKSILNFGNGSCTSKPFSE